MNSFEEIQHRAYQKYLERVRQGLTVDFEPDRTILEKRDWNRALQEYNIEQARVRLTR